MILKVSMSVFAVLALFGCRPPAATVDAARPSGDMGQLDSDGSESMRGPQATLRKWYEALRDNEYGSFRKCYGQYGQEYESIIRGVFAGLRGSSELATELELQFGRQAWGRFAEAASPEPAQILLRESWFKSLEMHMDSRGDAVVNDAEGCNQLWITKSGGKWYATVNGAEMNSKIVLEAVIQDVLRRQKRTLKVLKAKKADSPEAAAAVWRAMRS
jgi:hypothetical protein